MNKTQIKIAAFTVTIKTADEKRTFRGAQLFSPLQVKNAEFRSGPEAFLLFLHRGHGVLAFLKELERSERWDERSVFVETLIARAVLSSKMLGLFRILIHEKTFGGELNFF